MFSNKACLSLKLLEYCYSEQREQLMLLSCSSINVMKIYIIRKRKKIVGSPSIIFQRQMKVGETKIRN